MIVKILTDFNEYPGLRNCSISDNSGELFYHRILNGAFKQAFEKREQLIVDLDDTGGYASSFLDEAFGNLVYDFTLDNVSRLVEIISFQEPHWKTMIENETYVQWEHRRKNGEVPKVTCDHDAWFRLVNNEIKESVWEHSNLL